MVSEFFHADGWMDRRTNMIKLKVTFASLGMSLKMRGQWITEPVTQP